MPHLHEPKKDKRECLVIFRSRSVPTVVNRLFPGSRISDFAVGGADSKRRPHRAAPRDGSGSKRDDRCWPSPSLRSQSGTKSGEDRYRHDPSPRNERPLHANRIAAGASGNPPARSATRNRQTSAERPGPDEHLSAPSSEFPVGATAARAGAPARCREGEAIMSFEEFEDRFVWTCGGCGLSVEFAPQNFMGCWNELKARGWRARREQDGDGVDWSHKCGRCSRKAVAEFMNRKPRAVS